MTLEITGRGSPGGEEETPRDPTGFHQERKNAPDKNLKKIFQMRQILSYECF